MADKTGDEANRLTGRVARYARVGASVGKVGARMAAGRFLGVPTDQGDMAADLRQALGGLKGPLMKVAQLLATIPDALPSDYAAELAQLQSNAPAMGWPFVRRRMANELGKDWQTKFGSFDRDAAAAASLGQVHRATTTDGAPLACKLQYPNMQSAVEADLSQLKLIFGIYRRYDKAIDPSQIHQEIAERLREELDYEREARHQQLYAFILKDQPRVDVPQVVPELSTARLLTMGWLDGTPLMEVVDRPIEERNELAMSMFHAWYEPFYNFGVIHGDPHLGNYKVRPDMGVNLLDFGCIRVFPPSFVTGVIDLYHALLNDDRDLAVHAYETWGFTGLSNEVIDTLHLWAEFVYAPLLEDKKRAIQDEGTMYGARVASKVHGRLRELGGVTVPREFVFMDRAAIGLGSVFLHLQAEVNWYQIFHGLIEGYEEKALAKRQKAALKRVELSPPA
ncbi:MAG: ABC transporter ATP-binding protein [Rhodospirillaceae bacterium]|nr:ABC transporter ATP-binding protein [Rhodospirillaceae bacterium]|tara:strand:+ start:12415 stop:13767 length:1353 start_codon:yes stop_codon:yes gene_type:complete